MGGGAEKSNAILCFGPLLQHFGSLAAPSNHRAHKEGTGVKRRQPYHSGSANQRGPAGFWLFAGPKNRIGPGPIMDEAPLPTGGVERDEVSDVPLLGLNASSPAGRRDHGGGEGELAQTTPLPALWERPGGRREARWWVRPAECLNGDEKGWMMGNGCPWPCPWPSLVGWLHSQHPEFKVLPPSGHQRTIARPATVSQQCQILGLAGHHHPSPSGHNQPLAELHRYMIQLPTTCAAT